MMKVKTISANECKPLRHQVLWPHIERLEDCVIDIDLNEDAIHIGAFYNDELVSICSLFEMENEKLDFNHQYRLRAMATDPNIRGKNAGRAVVEFAIELLQSKSVDVLWCDAREIALGFYEKMGFSIEGDFYQVRNIGPHKLMYYPL